MKTLRFLPLLTLTATALLSACADQEQDAIRPRTAAQLLEGQAWKMTDCTVSPAWLTADNRLVTDYFREVMPAHDQDDVQYFGRGGQFRHDEGLTRAAGAPLAYAGTWALSPDGKLLRTTAEGMGSSSFDVQQLSPTTLRTSGTREQGGTRYTFTFTYTRQ